MASQPTHNPARMGWVYVLTNPAYAGLVKVGHTGRHPETRAAELSTTGVPTRFVVAYAHQVKDHEALEGLTHGRLDAYRVNQGREFFRCSVGQARRIIEQEARAQLMPWWQRLLYRLAHPLPAGRSSRRSPARRWPARSGIVGMLLAFGGAGLAIAALLHPNWLPIGALHPLWAPPTYPRPQSF